MSEHKTIKDIIDQALESGLGEHLVDTIHDIIEEYLTDTDNEYDGLCHRETECGCSKDDLFPCYRYGFSGPNLECEAAYERANKNGETEYWSEKATEPQPKSILSGMPLKLREPKQ